MHATLKHFRHLFKERDETMPDFWGGRFHIETLKRAESLLLAEKKTFERLAGGASLTDPERV